jgi:hypothetical protein
MKTRLRFAAAAIALLATGCVANQQSPPKSQETEAAATGIAVPSVVVEVASYRVGCVEGAGSMPGLEEVWDCLDCSVREPAELRGRRAMFHIRNDPDHVTDLRFKAGDVLVIDISDRKFTADSFLRHVEDMKQRFPQLLIERADIKAAQPGATDNPDDAQRLREDH